jgi:hypothetical protein
VTNASITICNDGIHDTLFNFTVIMHEVAIKFKSDFKVMLQKDENDKNYERETVKSSIDLEKAMKGALGNFFLLAFSRTSLKLLILS